MIFSPTPLQGSYIVQLDPRVDNRGWFVRSFCKREFSEINHDAEWVQINHSFTVQKGSIRGMHYQQPPHQEIKLVRCIRGGVFDVIVDIRQESPTFLKWFGTVLSADNANMIYIPEGFAHGFQTLTDDCELLYCHSEFYSPASERGIRFDDKLVGVKWPLEVTQVSERDLAHVALPGNFEGI